MKRISVFFSLIVFLSCHHNSKYTYAIKDFSYSLRHYLEKAVSNGVVSYDTDAIFIEKNASIQELERLSLSEHPILRAIALRIMADKKALNHFLMIMSHLDDTAIVATDEGEFGWGQKTVTDDMIENSTWDTEADKNKTLEKVILENNYLISAYDILPEINTELKYYASIKQMAQREVPYHKLEKALYYLATFKRKEDVPILKKVLLKNYWRLGRLSFGLMIDFPDLSYTEVLMKYAKYGLGSKNATYQDFFLTLAFYKNDSSLCVLKKLKEEISDMKCTSEKESIKSALFHAIWFNKCPLYTDLMKDVDRYMKKEVGIAIPGFPRIIWPDNFKHKKENGGYSW